MSRYSPTVGIYQPGAADVQNTLAQAIGAIEHDQDRRTQQRLLTEQEARQKNADAIAAADAAARQRAAEIAAYQAGYRTDVPREAAPVVPGIFRDQRLGPGQGGQQEQAPSIFQGQRLGVGGFAPQSGTPQVAPQSSTALLDQLDSIGTPGGAPTIKALPGQFIAGMGFAPTAIFEHPQALPAGPEYGAGRTMTGALLGRTPRRNAFAGQSVQDPELTRPGVADPSRYARLPSGGYLDLQATPEVRQQAQQQAQHEMLRAEGKADIAEQRNELASALSHVPGLTPEQAQAIAYGAPADLVAPAGPYGRGQTRDQFFRDYREKSRINLENSPYQLHPGATPRNRPEEDQATLDALQLIKRFGEDGALRHLDELGTLGDYEQAVRNQLVRLLATKRSGAFTHPRTSPFNLGSEMNDLLGEH